MYTPATHTPDAAGDRGFSKAAAAAAANAPPVFVWLDLLANDQRPPVLPSDDVTDPSELKSHVKDFGQGVAFVVDRGLHALTRSWCLFEAWSFVHYGNMTNIRVCLPGESWDRQTLVRSDVHSIILHPEPPHTQPTSPWLTS